MGGSTWSRRDFGFLTTHRGSSSHSWSLLLRSFPASEKFPPLFYSPESFSLSFPPSTLTCFSLFFFPSYYPFLVLTLSHILDRGFPGWRTYNFSPPSTTSHHESDRLPCCSILINFTIAGSQVDGIELSCSHVL
jgi:hypothetical protein